MHCDQVGKQVGEVDERLQVGSHAVGLESHPLTEERAHRGAADRCTEKGVAIEGNPWGHRVEGLVGRTGHRPDIARDAPVVQARAHERPPA